jgi:hypothetical protein
MKNYKEYVITTDVSSMGAYCLAQTQLLINIKKQTKKKDNGLVPYTLCRC